MSRHVIGAATDRGVKGVNEDWVLAARWELASNRGPVDYTLLLVLDGVTAGGGGQLASSTAGAAFVGTILRYLCHHYGEPPFNRKLSPRRILQDAAHQAHLEIRGMNQRGNAFRNVSTTLVAALIHGPRMWYASVGDSRLYMRRDNAWVQLTRDHSIVARQVELGVMTPEAAATSPDRHQIYNALGLASGFVCETGEMQVREGDVVMACSDGVYECLDLASAVASPPETAGGDLRPWCHALVEAAYDAGSDDNLGVAACCLRELGELDVTLQPTVLQYGERWRPVDWPGGSGGTAVPAQRTVFPYGSDVIPDD